jgi:ornithine carbamoyltransferase
MGEVEDADVVITDCWPADAGDEDLLPYQVTAALLDRLRPDAIFIPCPPVARGREVSEDAMLAARCRVTEAKSFLLHGQNAVLEWLVG